MDDLDLDSILSRVPSYASLPRIGHEQTIEYTPRGGVRGATPPLGNVVRKWRSATVILKDADQIDEDPTYGRSSIIEGEVDLPVDDAVKSVTVKLDGQLELSISDGGSTTIVVAAEKQILWSQDEADSRERCPSLLPFFIPFPTTYIDGGREHKIPPSYEAIFYGVPALCVRCTYMLHVTVSRKLRFWKPSKTYSIRLNYRPRTRPSRPILQTHSLFSSIKPLPEEWRQIVTKMRSRSSLNLESIQCHFLIPSVQTFGLRDAIPFHIQLTAPLSSLRHFLPPIKSFDECSVHSDSRSSQKTQSKRSLSLTEPKLRVFVARQILVDINGKKSWRNSTLGEGTIRSIPPCVCSSDANDSSEVTADWEGEVRCREEVNSVGFNIGNLIVKDFIVIELTPPNPRASPFLQLQHAHPIRLVTDTWVDEELAHPMDL